MKEGGVVYGGSGGASILGKSINYDQKNNLLQKTMLDSSDLCIGYSIFTHLNENNLKSIKDLSEGNVVGLPEKGSCMINLSNNKLLYIGQDDGIIINHLGIKKLMDKESIDMLTL